MLAISNNGKKMIKWSSLGWVTYYVALPISPLQMFMQNERQKQTEGVAQMFSNVGKTEL